MRKKTGISFKLVYGIFLCLMIVMGVAAVIYVRIALGEYRDSLPERIVEEQIELLRQDAAGGALWTKYPPPES